jgi:hypothetical protein
MKEHIFESAFGLSDVVFLRCRDEPMRGMITAVTFKSSGLPLYAVTWGSGSETWHYECEISAEYVPVFKGAWQT